MATTLGAATFYELGSANNPITDPAASRPAMVPKVFWQCPTQPTNWATGDEWINNS